MATLYFLGTCAALPVADRTNTALALLGDDPTGGLLIDCGGDIFRAMLRANLSPDACSDLFITHAHIDHIGSLPSLIESLRLGGRTRPLTISAIPEVLAVARRILEVFDYEINLHHWSFEVRFREIERGTELRFGQFSGRIERVDHAIPTAGIRIELPGGALAYTSDTQPSPAIERLGRGAGMLITECTFLEGNEAFARRAKHLTAVEVGQQAAACGVPRLALVHVGVGEGWNKDAAREQVARSFTGEVHFPVDGDIYEL